MTNLVLDGSFCELFLWFFCYCVLGWLWESTYRSFVERRFVNSGFLVGPYIPIYGTGAMLYLILLHFTKSPIELFFLGGTIACLLEYITSWTMEKLFHARWWDYSSRIANINGRICLVGFLAFGFFAVIMPYLHACIGPLIINLPSIWKIFLTITLSLMMISDTINTSRSLKNFNRTLARYQKEIERHTAKFIDFIRQGRRSFEMRFTKGQHHNREVLTFQQRRIMRAFPNLRSTAYPDALRHIRKLYEDANRRMFKNRYRPIRSQKPKNQQKGRD